ncbi:MAG: hypothetical protein WC027_01725 [Candidatus Paceibacterota bacterium]
MQLVTIQSLECELKEFLAQYWETQEPPPVADNDFVVHRFQGDCESPARYYLAVEVRDQRGDHTVRLQISSREFLCRFCSFGDNLQANFIKGVQAALREVKVGCIVIRVPWSKTTSRKIQIEAGGADLQNMNIKLLPQ